MKRLAIIMAGGNGTRFWPMSRESRPKQFQAIGSDDTLLNDTIKRISKSVPVENIYIVASLAHKELLEETLPDSFKSENILLEPIAKNTAAAIACSVQYLNNQFGDINLGIFPADHFIKDEAEFTRVINRAYDVSENTSKLVTLGIPTTFASTGYGYLKVKMNQTVAKDVFELDNFVEKPNHKKAIEYLNSNSHFWNSGVLFTKSSVILNKIFQHMPELYLYSSQVSYWNQELHSGELLHLYNSMESTSIDYGVLEHCSRLEMLVLDAGWSDLGSWDALPDVLDQDSNGNINNDDNLLIDTKNSVIVSKKKFVAAIGLENIIVVETKDSLLICSKDHAQDIKLLVNKLKEQGRYELT